MRLFVLALFLPVVTAAQVQLSLYDGTSEKPVAAVTDVGAVPAGDVREIRFHVRNSGGTPATIQKPTFPGQGFEEGPAPLWPVLVAPGNFVEFRVRFSAVLPGTYTAVLNAAGIQTLLRASVGESATVSMIDGASGSLITSGATIDFGRVKRGTSAVRQLRIGNGNLSALEIKDCSVSGTGFSASGMSCPATLPPGDAAILTLTFAPTAEGEYRGSIAVAGRNFALAGIAFVPPLPRPSLEFDAPLISGVQRRLSIRLASAAESHGTGTVIMDFRPLDPSLPDDSALRFTTTGSRALSFTVAEGGSAGVFPAGIDATFQTGTTAGTLVFKVKLGEYQEEIPYAIASTPVAFDAVTLSRRPGTIDVAVTGFDNTRTAGRFAFTFFDTAGRVIQPGAIRADWGEPFSNYFKTSKVGGSFVMRASFPVTGDPSSIGSVEVEAINSTGAIRTDRILMTGVLP